MNGRQFRETERNIRSDEFLTANIADFAANRIAKEDIADLTARVARVRAAYHKQMAGGGDIRREYAAVKDVYQELVDEMRDIAGFARSMERRAAGVSELFRVPSGSGRRKLVAAARVFAANAAEHKKMFIDYGLDATFIEDLLNRADALDAALNAAAATTGAKVGATDTLAADVDAASDIVDGIDPIARRVYRDNPAKLAAWQFASRVERHTPVSRPTGANKPPPT